MLSQDGRTHPEPCLDHLLLLATENWFLELFLCRFSDFSLFLLPFLALGRLDVRLSDGHFGRDAAVAVAAVVGRQEQCQLARSRCYLDGNRGWQRTHR